MHCVALKLNNDNVYFYFHLPPWNKNISQKFTASCIYEPEMAYIYFNNIYILSVLINALHVQSWVADNYCQFEKEK